MTNTIISLGIHCFTRTILTRWKIKPTKEQGELTCPFDLCVCPLNSVYNLLRTKFATFFDGIYFDEEAKVFKNRDYKILFNHDTDITDIEQLKERYTRRIHNFYDILQRDTKKIFICTTVNDASNIDSVDKIANIVQPYGLFVWSHIGKTNIQENLTRPYPFFYLRNPYPHYYGEWYKKEFYNTDEGKAFETAYTEKIQQYLATL
jgi:hypothetical protein